VRPGRTADDSPPSSAVVMEEKSYTCTQSLGHTGPVTGKLYFLLDINYLCLLTVVKPTNSYHKEREWHNSKV